MAYGFKNGQTKSETVAKTGVWLADKLVAERANDLLGQHARLLRLDIRKHHLYP